MARPAGYMGTMKGVEAARKKGHKMVKEGGKWIDKTVAAKSTPKDSKMQSLTWGEGNRPKGYLGTSAGVAKAKASGQTVNKISGMMIASGKAKPVSAPVKAKPMARSAPVAKAPVKSSPSLPVVGNKPSFAVGGKLSKNYASLPKYKKGGKVKKTGPAILHKGEKVLKKKSAKKFDQKKFDDYKNKVFGLK